MNPLTLQTEILVSNSGSGPGFVRFMDSENITIHPKEFTLESGRSKPVYAEAKKKTDNIIGHLVAYHGSEVLRLIWRKVGKSDKPNDFFQIFDGENENSHLNGFELKLLSQENLSPFYDSLERFEFDVGFTYDCETLQPTGEKDLQRFHRLQPEETFMTNNSLQISHLSVASGKQVQRQPHREHFQEGEIEMAILGVEKNQILRGADFSLVEAKLARYSS